MIKENLKLMVGIIIFEYVFYILLIFYIGRIVILEYLFYKIEK